MPKRYFSKPTAMRPRNGMIDENLDGENYLSRTVYEHDNEPFHTGLYDRHGNELWAMEARNPIGFVVFASEDDD